MRIKKAEKKLIGYIFIFSFFIFGCLKFIDLAKEQPQIISESKETKSQNSMLKLNKTERLTVYALLAKRICVVSKRPGNALYYEKCLKKYFKEYYDYWEAEVRMAGLQ